MKQKFLSLFVVFSLSLLSSYAFALEIGVIDLKNISKESKAISYVEKEVKEQKENFQKEIDKKRNSLERDVQKFKEKAEKMKKEDVEKKQKALQKDLNDLKESAEKKQKSLNEGLNKALEEVNSEMQKIIAKISKEKGLKLVVTSAQAVYFEDSLDITQEVIKELNNKVSKVKVKF